MNLKEFYNSFEKEFPTYRHFKSKQLKGYRDAARGMKKDQRKQYRELFINSLLSTGEVKNVQKFQIFELFTGLGNLEELPNKEDYKNFFQYISSKRDHNKGQFFTDSLTAQSIVQILSPEENAKLFDPTCGHGVFANYIRNNNFYGVEIDPNNVLVANYLFPKANIVEGNILTHTPNTNFDYIISNPPFNHKWNDDISQSYILKQAVNWLSPYGIIAIIVPESFLSDDYYYKSTIEFINNNYNFLGGTQLPSVTFKKYSLNFNSKILFFQKDKTPVIPFTNELIGTLPVHDFIWKSDAEILNKLITNIQWAKDRKKSNIMEVFNAASSNKDFSFSLNEETLYPVEETGNENINDKINKKVYYSRKDTKQYYEFIVTKLIYEIEKHKDDESLVRAMGYVNKYNNQKRDETLSDKEWNAIKLTPKKLIALLKNILHERKRKNPKYVGDADQVQLTPFSELVVPDSITNYFKEFQFNNEYGTFNLLPYQLEDVSKFAIKKHGFCNAQQGTGKTVIGYSLAKYRFANNQIKKTIVFAPKNVIVNTWVPFMEQNNESFAVINTYQDALDHSDKDFWLFSYSTFKSKRKWHRNAMKAFKKIMRQLRWKVQILADESHSFANRNTATYKSIRNLAHAKYKLCMTGTATLNNAVELYSQLEFLYNNSYNMIDNTYISYYEKTDKETGKYISSKENDNWGNRFHPFYGQGQFQKAFQPSKATVFGMKKNNQDVYNKDVLLNILSYTMITRRFKDVVGDKFTIHQKTVKPTIPEYNLMQEIVDNLREVRSMYYNLSSNERINAGRRMLDLIRLLIKATSIPQKFVQYTGYGSSKMSAIMQHIKKNPNTYVAIGCTYKEGVNVYKGEIEKLFPNRDLTVITGDIPAKKRLQLINKVKDSKNGILLCTQQSLASGLNINFIDEIIVESYQWNIAKIEQWYFRFIRLNSKNRKNVYFYTYADSIETNMLRLLMAKEKINRLLILDEVDVLDEFDLSVSNLLDQCLEIEYKDKDGKETKTISLPNVGWGDQQMFN
jgi:phospholipid N-methyltransferase